MYVGVIKTHGAVSRRIYRHIIRETVIMSAPKCDQHSGVVTRGSHINVTNKAVMNTDQSMINTVEQMAWRSQTHEQ